MGKESGGGGGKIPSANKLLLSLLFVTPDESESRLPSPLLRSIPTIVLPLRTLEVSPHMEVASLRQEDGSMPPMLLLLLPPEEGRRSHLELFLESVSILWREVLLGSGFSFPSGGSLVSNESASSDVRTEIGINVYFPCALLSMKANRGITSERINSAKRFGQILADEGLPKVVRGY
jgi:hypothetical protein